MKVIGQYKKRYGIDTNVNEIVKIIKPYTKSFSDGERTYMARGIWQSISKVQHLNQPEQVIYDTSVEDAKGALEYAKQQVKMHLAKGKDPSKLPEKYKDLL